MQEGNEKEDFFKWEKEGNNIMKEEGEKEDFFFKLGRRVNIVQEGNEKEDFFKWEKEGIIL